MALSLSGQPILGSWEAPPTSRMPSHEIATADQPGDLMSNLYRIASELPYLRRFARGLSGSQQSGDASVVAMLHAIAADPALISTDLKPKLATFRTYLKLWNSARLNHEMERTSITAETAASDCKLAAIRPRERQAYLLMAVEEFSAA